MRMRFSHAADDKKKKLDTPASTLNKIRTLIEDDGEFSTTDLADRLNGFTRTDGDRPSEPKFPRATGSGDWTSADVSSLLDRKDMESLKTKLTENRPKPEPTPAVAGGISPLEFRQALANDFEALLKTQNTKLDSTLASVVDGISAVLRDAERGTPALDLVAIKAAVGDAVNSRLRGFQGGTNTEALLDKVVADTADEVCKVFEQVIEKSDLPAVRRMSEAAANNVGEVCKKIDDLTAELFDELKTGLSDSSTIISEIVVEHIEERFAAFMSQVNEKVQAAIDEKLGATITESVKAAFGGIQNSHATQVAHFGRKIERLEAAIDDMLDKKVTVRLDRIGDRLKRLEDSEEEWNGSE